jgi:hypothetical protein
MPWILVNTPSKREFLKISENVIFEKHAFDKGESGNNVRSAHPAPTPLKFDGMKHLW